jgi:ribosomal protein S18 acetylase RimI-like enzyme
MCTNIQEIGSDQFPRYDAIPNRYEVRSIFRVEAIDGGLGGFRLAEERVAEPYVRDYDSHGDDNPAAWSTDFDLGRWGIFLAIDGAERAVGGAAVALNASVYPMDRFQRRDLAVLWDIRVHPDDRGRGVGSKLFRYAADWARRRGYGQLGLETDSANVPACRFYRRQGCELGAIHRFGYAGVPEVAHNAMLLWYLDL